MVCIVSAQEALSAQKTLFAALLGARAAESSGSVLALPVT